MCGRDFVCLRERGGKWVFLLIRGEGGVASRESRVANRERRVAGAGWSRWSRVRSVAVERSSSIEGSRGEGSGWERKSEKCDSRSSRARVHLTSPEPLGIRRQKTRNSAIDERRKLVPKRKVACKG